MSEIKVMCGRAKRCQAFALAERDKVIKESEAKKWAEVSASCGKSDCALHKMGREARSLESQRASIEIAHQKDLERLQIHGSDWLKAGG